MEEANRANAAFGGFIFLIILLIALMFLIAAVLFRKQGKKEQHKKLLIIGNIFMFMGSVCAVPVVACVGYFLYLFIGIRLL